MPTSIIKIPNRLYETYELNEDGEFVATHEDAYLEAPCCTSRGPNGFDCGCQGQYSVICPAADCPGIADHEVDGLFDRLMVEPDFDDRGDDE